MIEPEYFDIFGIMGFVVLFFIGLKIVKVKKVKNYGYLILIFSILGLLADGYILVSKFILGH